MNGWIKCGAGRTRPAVYRSRVLSPVLAIPSLLKSYKGVLEKMMTAYSAQSPIYALASHL